jgi:hypothetical protein
MVQFTRMLMAQPAACGCWWLLVEICSHWQPSATISIQSDPTISWWDLVACHIQSAFGTDLRASQVTQVTVCHLLAAENVTPDTYFI